MTVNLEPGREYEFRYQDAVGNWHDDVAADRYQSNPFGSDNCVLCT